MEFLFTKEEFKKIGKVSGVYRIHVAHHTYIGSAINIRSRMRTHLWTLAKQSHHNHTMQNAYNKYTVSQMKFEILEECAKQDLRTREGYYIKLLKPDMNHILDPVELTRDGTFKQRISAAKKKYYETHEVKNKIKVYQYSINGEFIAEFNSITEAAQKFNIGPQTIIKICKLKTGTSGGYQWRYEKLNSIDRFVRKPGVKPILQISKDGKIIHIWKTQIEIENTLGFNRKFISVACESGELFNDFYWKKGESKRDLKKKKPKFIPGVPVHQYSLDGTYIRSFNSAKEAERNTGINCSTISQTCRSDTINKSAGGFLWSTIKYDIYPDKYQNFSNKAKIKKVWIFDIFSGEEFEFESIASAIRFISPNSDKFDSDCAALSYCSKNGGIFKHYVSKQEDTDYKISNRNTKIYNKKLNKIYNSLIDAAKEVGLTKYTLKKLLDESNNEWEYLNNCARVKLRESGKTFL